MSGEDTRGLGTKMSHIYLSYRTKTRQMNGSVHCTKQISPRICANANGEEVTDRGVDTVPLAA